MSERVTLRNDAGVPALTYLPSTLDHRPAAEDVTLLPGADVPTAVALLRAELPGGVVSGDETVLNALLTAGARNRRYAHVYSWDLVRDRPPAQWATLQPLPPCSFATAAGRSAEDLLGAARSAYPLGHVDAVRDSRQDLRDILAGRLVGPLLDRSELVLAGDQVVAALLLNDSRTDGPWVTDVFRKTGAAYAGLGSLLLRRALAHLALDGRGSLGLAVTDGNPARRRYELLGFRHASSSRTVFLPE